MSKLETQQDVQHHNPHSTSITQFEYDMLAVGKRGKINKSSLYLSEKALIFMIKLSAKKFFIHLISISISFVILHIIGQAVQLSGILQSSGVIDLFNLEKEFNLPTLWSSILLLIACTLLYATALLARKQNHEFIFHWRLLSFIFLMLALDETIGFHEKIGGNIGNLFQTSGIFYYSWLIPALIFVIILTFFYLRFLFSLPSDIRNLFIISGSIFIGGAVGLEMIESYMAEAGEYMSPLYNVCVVLEEFMEMLGVTIFIYSLIKYIGLLNHHLSIQLTDTSFSGSSTFDISKSTKHHTLGKYY